MTFPTFLQGDDDEEEEVKDSLLESVNVKEKVNLGEESTKIRT